MGFCPMGETRPFTGTRLEQFVQCVAVLDDYFEAFLARMGELQDLRILNQKNVRD